jgi:hypothetical protein
MWVMAKGRKARRTCCLQKVNSPNLHLQIRAVHKLAPATGLEPVTKWLTATYSTIELRRNTFVLESGGKIGQGAWGVNTESATKSNVRVRKGRVLLVSCALLWWGRVGFRLLLRGVEGL